MAVKYLTSKLRKDNNRMPETAVRLPLLPAIYCKCGMLLAFYMIIGNQVWIQAGALQLKEAHGWCCNCNTEYHWLASKQHLIDLLKLGKEVDVHCRENQL